MRGSLIGPNVKIKTDGKTGSYHENDVPSPINYYGLSKIIGDAFALSYDT